MGEKSVPAGEKSNFAYLLISLLLLFLVLPLFESLGKGFLLFGLFYSATLLSAVKAVSRKRRHFTMALLFALPAIASHWGGVFLQAQPLLLLGNILSVLFLSWTAALLLSHVLGAEKVTAKELYGALCVYLLIGLIWALCYFIVDFFLPGSFRPDLEGMKQSSLMLYYSFVTLTTLGYGDVVPVSPPARSLAALEALMGQVFLAVLIARLVSLHVIHSQRDN